MSCANLSRLDDPVALLAHCYQMLKPGGRLACIVAHGDSLHRRVDVHMGLLPDMDALGDVDGALDRKRVYTIASLQSDVINAGFEIIDSGGICLNLCPTRPCLRWNRALSTPTKRLVVSYRNWQRRSLRSVCAVLELGAQF